MMNAGMKNSPTPASADRRKISQGKGREEDKGIMGSLHRKSRAGAILDCSEIISSLFSVNDVSRRAFGELDFQPRNSHFRYLPEKAEVAILVGDKGGLRCPVGFQTLCPVEPASFESANTVGRQFCKSSS